MTTSLREIRKALASDPHVQEVFQKFAAEFLAKNFPNMAAAMDAYKQSREYQEAVNAQEHRMKFPALHSTQPEMARAYAMQQYGG
jgi:hypothetical protein